jgi:hypothetical protein
MLGMQRGSYVLRPHQILWRFLDLEVHDAHLPRNHRSSTLPLPKRTTPSIKPPKEPDGSLTSTTLLREMANDMANTTLLHYLPLFVHTPKQHHHHPISLIDLSAPSLVAFDAHTHCTLLCPVHLNCSLDTLPACTSIVTLLAGMSALLHLIFPYGITSTNAYNQH